jgi:hypothetical protein
LTEKLTEKLTNLTKSDEKSTENGTPVPPEELPAVATSKKRNTFRRHAAEATADHERRVTVTAPITAQPPRSPLSYWMPRSAGLR